MNKNISIYIFVYLYSQTTMVTFTRNRKIARSTIRRVKRNKLSKNVKRVLKRKVSKRKVMKGGEGDFKVYLVYYTKTKGLFTCESARLPFSVLGVLFYSEANNDFFYFGYRNFGKPFNFVKDKRFFKENEGFNIFSNTRSEYSQSNILDEELAFIGHLCSLAIDSDQIQSLKSGINQDGILPETTVKCCAILNRTKLFNKVELKYCSTGNTTSYVSDDVDDNEQVTNTKYELKTVGEINKQTQLTIPSGGEVQINVHGLPCYFFLERVNYNNDIKKGLKGLHVLDAIEHARNVMNNIYSIPLINYNNNPNNRTILKELNSCLDQMKQQQPPAQPPGQPPAQPPAQPPPPAPVEVTAS